MVGRGLVAVGAAIGLVFLMLGGVVGCAGGGKLDRSGARDGAVTLVAKSPRDRQWTGVAYVPETADVELSLIVNYPTWSRDDLGNAVERLDIDTRRAGRWEVTERAWPPYGWNAWRTGVIRSESLPGHSQFVAVQSVHTDRAGRLWILDTGNPFFGGVVEDGAKLLRVGFDGASRPERVYRFPEEIASGDTYLNDVRIDLERDRAYITDSGKGGLVVVDLATGAMRRVLDGHPSTLAEPGFTPVIGGRAFRTAEGDTPQIHADGIAVSPDERWVYWQALTGRTLYRLPAALLADFSVSDEQLAAAVEDMGRTVVTDGMEFDSAGNLYFSALEHDAVMYRTPGGEIRTLWQSELLSWPDSFAYDAAGNRLFVTTAAIHRGPVFGGGDGEWPPAEGFRIYMIELGE